MNNDKKQIEWLNTVKGLACWMVFLGHFECDFPYIPGLQGLYDKLPVLQFISDETMALNMFYIVIGFVAASRFADLEKDFASKAGKSVIKRYFRLTLPVFLMNLIVLILQMAGLGSDRVSGMFLVKYTFPGALRDAFVEAPFIGSNVFNTNVWMLNHLFIGYIFALIACMIVRTLDGKKEIPVLVVISLLLWMCDFYPATIIFGVFLQRVAVADRTEKMSSALRNCLGLAFLIAGILVTSYSRWFPGLFSESLPEKPLRVWWDYCWAGAMLIMAGLVLSPLLKKVLEIKPLPFLGRICFPVYLFHRVWNATFVAKVYQHYYGPGMDKGAGCRAAFPVSVLMTLGFSLIYYFLIEPYLNKLTDLIVNRITSRRAHI
jgi:peptidoglycan/LPS O-acetylase OafA/YrhL